MLFWVIVRVWICATRRGGTQHMNRRGKGYLIRSFLCGDQPPSIQKEDQELLRWPYLSASLPSTPTGKQSPQPAALPPTSSFCLLNLRPFFLLLLFFFLVFFLFFLIVLSSPYCCQILPSSPPPVLVSRLLC
jgi:hypothetical protein